MDTDTTTLPERGSDHNNAALLNLVTESWRFAKVFERIIGKMDAGEQTRYVNQYRFFVKKIEDSLALEGYRLVNLEGHPFDAGIAATALNLDDFQTTDLLVVEQMLEPLIMGEQGIIKIATVLLRKVER